MFADRDLEERLDDISDASTKHACDMSGRLLKIDIDGMDQAKYKNRMLLFDVEVDVCHKDAHNQFQNCGLCLASEPDPR